MFPYHYFIYFLRKCLLSQQTNEVMEKEGLYLCEKCGENVPDGGDFSSHLCAKDLTSVKATLKARLKSYKCPLCSEAFLMPGALKRHFRTHRDEPKGPFRCSEQGCRFSVPDLRAYQDHLSSEHALTLVPCTFRSCSQAFRSQAEMQAHRRNHMPFHCPRCDFVTAQAKTLSAHSLEHDCPAAAPEGKTGVNDAVHCDFNLVPRHLCPNARRDWWTDTDPKSKDREKMPVTLASPGISYPSRHFSVSEPRLVVV